MLSFNRNVRIVESPIDDHQFYKAMIIIIGVWLARESNHENIKTNSIGIKEFSFKNPYKDIVLSAKDLNGFFDKMSLLFTAPSGYTLRATKIHDKSLLSASAAMIDASQR
jgi:hypothetical protein